MSEQELQLLITLDDPGYGPEEDVFHHLQTKNNLEYWLNQQFPAWRRLEQRTVSDNAAANVTFGQGEWTCTLSRVTVTPNGDVVEPLSKKFDIDVCTVTHWNNGEIIEQKLFYDLGGSQQ